MIDRDRTFTNLKRVVADSASDRTSALQTIADSIKQYGDYRWVGLYDVVHSAGIVRNIVWSGPESPAFPNFPMTKGLTGVAVSEKQTINVADVTNDPRYLTAFGTTRSEIIVPIFDSQNEIVVGTIDVESEAPDAFDAETQKFLEACADVIRPLWVG